MSEIDATHNNNPRQLVLPPDLANVVMKIVAVITSVRPVRCEPCLAHHARMTLSQNSKNGAAWAAVAFCNTLMKS